jgi:hypothetical protein
MSKSIVAGLFTEGTTDIHFLKSVVKRTFDDVAFECTGDIEIELQVIIIDKTGLDFIDQVKAASREGLKEYGIMLLCVHTDSDNESDRNAFEFKLVPAQKVLEEMSEKEFCKILTPVVPIQMIEAWMLADIELLKKEIGTTKSDFELGFHRSPESISDPKTVIKEAIRIASISKTKRRRHDLDISELYLPIGRKVDLKKLEGLPSYHKFKELLRDSLRQLNYLH